jgi:hypothetical protein
MGKRDKCGILVGSPKASVKTAVRKYNKKKA